MDINRRTVIRSATGVAALAAFGVAEGASGSAFASTSSSSSSSSTSSAYSLEFDSAAWSYDSTNDVYYQTGRCTWRTRLRLTTKTCRSTCRAPI